MKRWILPGLVALLAATLPGAPAPARAAAGSAAHGPAGEREHPGTARTAGRSRTSRGRTRRCGWRGKRRSRSRARSCGRRKRSRRKRRTVTRTARLTVAMPRRGKASRGVKTVRVHKRIRNFRRSLRVQYRIKQQRTRWSRRVRAGDRLAIDGPRGERWAQLVVQAQYDPKSGRLRYAIGIQNDAIPDGHRKAAQVVLELRARYKA